jgi:selenocysteine lyase/cysteine desulfurase
MPAAILYPTASFDPRLWRARRDARDTFPFNAPRAHWFGMARAAIWHGVHVLGLRAGDEILVPAFNCGSEVDPLVQAGLKLVYYGVDEEFNARPEEIASLVTSQTRALYVTHFFGFPQTGTDALGAVAAENQIPLIEDCAHGLFSRHADGRILGKSGDISIFSMRKTLPIGDGAALVLNRPGLPDPDVQLHHRLLHQLSPRWRRDGARGDHGREEHTGARDGEPAASANPGRTPLTRDQSFIRERQESQGMSRLAHRVMLGSNVNDIVAKRRRNFEVILESLPPGAGLRPVFRVLPEGTSPLAFPLFADDPRRVVLDLRRKGILARRWWAHFHAEIPWDSLPDAVFLKTHLVAIPVQQGIAPERLAAAVKELRG